METIQCLLELQQNHSSHLVIEALGLISSENWCDDIEVALAGALSHKETAYAAAYALYRHEQSVTRVATLQAIASSINSRDCFSDIAVTALICLTKRTHSDIALKLLREILEDAKPALREEIAKTLGWATD